MVGKLVRSEIAPRKMIISVAEHLHFYSTINSFVKSGSKDSIRCLGDL
jgi:glycyl-tRNA synthetase (class II)